MTAFVAARRCVAVAALVTVAAAVAALPAAGGRESSLSVKLTYPPDGAKIALAPPGTLTRVTLTYNVTGSCKLGEPFVDPYARDKGASRWIPGPLGGGIGAS